MSLPSARGPLSRCLLDVLSAPVHQPDQLATNADRALASLVDVLIDEDVQLALYLMYELHYGGLEGVNPDWEWSPGLLAVRARLELRLEATLRQTFRPPLHGTDPAAVPQLLFDLTSPSRQAPGRSLPGYVARQATREQLAELMVVRSVYQLKEADPHTWAIPRLRGAPKAALVEIQTDEYGGGRADRMHAELFATSMRAQNLDDTPNAYLDLVPALPLAAVNALSMFGLHRRLRGALCGHLAAFEMTSSLPAKRYVSGMQRLRLGEDAIDFFDEHVEADAVHEQIAAHDLCGALARQEPQLIPDVLFGAVACVGLDSLGAEQVLDAWSAGGSALRRPLTAALGDAVS